MLTEVDRVLGHLVDGVLPERVLVFLVLAPPEFGLELGRYVVVRFHVRGVVFDRRDEADVITVPARTGFPRSSLLSSAICDNRRLRLYTWGTHW
jgi:hypothetical protein